MATRDPIPRPPMFRLSLTFALICSVSTAAHASKLTLTVDRQTGEAWIENLSNTAVTFDAYTIQSAGGHFDLDSWFSFEKFILADATAAQAALGSLAWAEFNSNANSIVEGNLASETTADPGFRIAIGSPIDTFVAGDLTFQFNDFSKPTNERVVDGLLNLIGDAPHPWQNPDNVFDVDGSGRLTVIDALTLINRLNSDGPHSLPIPPPNNDGPPPFLDVNADDSLTVLDALDVINELNRVIGSSGAAAAPEPGSLALGGAGAVLFAVGRLISRRRRN